MKLSKLIATSVAGILALGSMAISASALADGEVFIMYADNEWLAQYWDDGKEYASVMETAQITGDGSYSVTVTAGKTYEDEETGEMVTAEGGIGLAFAALGVPNGETAYPGMILTVDSVLIDGAEVALAGVPYTSSDDGVVTRANLYNSWVSALPDDARTADGDLSAATPIALPAGDIGEWTTMTVNFTVSNSGIAAAPAEDTAAPAEDAATVPTAEKGSPDTGIEGVAAVAAVAVLAAGALVISKKRK